MKEEKFPHTREPLHCWGQGVGGEGSFGATKESAGSSMRKALLLGKKRIKRKE